ncbi:MAG: hypothetical protein ACHQF2_00625 [Flavobacteriales bacterium]
MKVTHPLAKQGYEILKTIKSFSSTYEDDTFEGDYIKSLISSSQIMYVKASVAVKNYSYLVSIQNAALMREEGQHLLAATSGMKMYTNLDQDYVKLLRKEILEFQRLFVEWVTTLKKNKPVNDETEVDEWGLF